MSCRQYLYVSYLAPGASSHSVGSIIKQSRTNNARARINGALVFDGERFAQYVEGDPSHIETLIHHLRKDPRHVKMQVLLDISSEDDIACRLKEWTMGYAYTEDSIDKLAGLRGVEALKYFLEVIESLDMET